MTLSGPQALASLEEALRDIRREEDDLAKRLARSNERVAKLRETEAELFRKLAMVRLEGQSQTDLADAISTAEAKARDMLKQHAEDLSRAEAELKSVDAEIAAASARRTEALGKVDARQGELKALAARIAANVAKDPAYARQREEAAHLDAVAAESARKTAQAEDDRQTKGKPYRDDPLFMYLWERGYGTKNYRANGLVAYFDAKIARMLRYEQARPNFVMLNDIPLRLKEHADRQSANAQAAEDELDLLETQAIDAAGGQPLREALTAAQAEMEAIDGETLALEDRRDETARTVRQLAQGSDPAFAQVLAAFTEGLGREDIKTLLAQARLTRTGQDDTIVAQIDDLRARVRDEEAETRDQRERAKTLAARRRELEDIQYEFKKARYDDPRSTFKQDSLVGDLLTDFLRGGISAGNYWEHWRRSQNWAPGSSDWGGGVGLPRNGRRPQQPERSGGGFSWPKSSTVPPPSPGGFGGGWRPSGGSNSGGGSFSRPRTPSGGKGKGGGFTTGGRF